MNDYDEEALVARSRCNHTLGRNEAAIEDGELQVLCKVNKCALSICILNNSSDMFSPVSSRLTFSLAARAGLAKNKESISATEALGKVVCEVKSILSK